MRSGRNLSTQASAWHPRPGRGESFAQIAIRVATCSPFEPLRRFRRDAPDGLEAVISTCLEKDKNRRYANLAELALALADFGTKQSTPSIERIVRIVQASGLSTDALALPLSPVVARTPVPSGTKLSERLETAVFPESGGDGAARRWSLSTQLQVPTVSGAARRRGEGLISVASAVGSSSVFVVL